MTQYSSVNHEIPAHTKLLIEKEYLLCCNTRLRVLTHTHTHTHTQSFHPVVSPVDLTECLTVRITESTSCKAKQP